MVGTLMMHRGGVRLRDAANRKRRTVSSASGQVAHRVCRSRTPGVVAEVWLPPPSFLQMICRSAADRNLMASRTSAAECAMMNRVKLLITAELEGYQRTEEGTRTVDPRRLIYTI